MPCENPNDFDPYHSLFFLKMSTLKNYIVTCKETASEADISTIKSRIGDLGGSILNEFSLIKGFTASLPEHHFDIIKNHEHVFNVEEDKEVKIN